MTVLGLIPARGGSKGIPRKNLRPIAGKPLINWTIETALATPGLDAVVVSTDDERIAEVARDAGAEVPFLRPSELATDHTPGVEPVLHALGVLPPFDAVVLLQPTSPLRGVADIKGVLALAATRGSPSVVSLREAADHPAWMFSLDGEGRLRACSDGGAIARRQDLPPVHTLNGAIYFARSDWLLEQRRLVAPDTLGYVMSARNSVDIDDPLDWMLAEALLRELGCSQAHGA